MLVGVLAVERVAVAPRTRREQVVLVEQARRLEEARLLAATLERSTARSSTSFMPPYSPAMYERPHPPDALELEAASGGCDTQCPIEIGDVASASALPVSA